MKWDGEGNNSLRARCKYQSLDPRKMYTVPLTTFISRGFDRPSLRHPTPPRCPAQRQICKIGHDTNITHSASATARYKSFFSYVGVFILPSALAGKYQSLDPSPWLSIGSIFRVFITFPVTQPPLLHVASTILSYRLAYIASCKYQFLVRLHCCCCLLDQFSR